MAIEGTLTDTTPSPDFTPSAVVSDVYVVIRKGSLALKAKRGSMDPVTVSVISGSGTFPVSTADAGITYFLEASGQEIDVDYYMGP